MLCSQRTPAQLRAGLITRAASSNALLPLTPIGADNTAHYHAVVSKIHTHRERGLSARVRRSNLCNEYLHLTSRR